MLEPDSSELLAVFDIAVNSNMSFEEALAPHAKVPSSLLHFLSYALIPFSAILLPKHYQEVAFARQCKRILAALESGASLHRALAKHAKYYISPQTLTALEDADRNGHLPETLGILRSKPISKVRAGEFLLAIGYFAVIMFFVLLLGRLIGRVLLPQETEAARGLFLSACLAMTEWINVSTLYDVVVIAISCAVVVALLVYFWQGQFRNKLALSLPFAFNRAQVDREVSLGGIATALRAGCDITEAIEWTAATCQSPRIRKRLTRCATAIRNGRSWRCAWQEYWERAYGHSTAEWILLAQEDPVQGFESRARWLAECEQRHHRRFAARARLVSTLVCTIIVGGIAVDVFRHLIGIIYATMP